MKRRNVKQDRIECAVETAKIVGLLALMVVLAHETVAAFALCAW